jgi:uncharacterized protein (TIGR02271 family)
LRLGVPLQPREQAKHRVTPARGGALRDQQLSKGGFLLVAQGATASRGDAVLRLLAGLQRDAEPQAPAAPAAQEEAPQVAAAEAATDEEGAGEERIPLVQEELRIGKREVVRGRSRVHTYVAEVPVREEVELFHEETSIERRPVNRRLSEEEVAQGGLLQERVIEIAEMREEPVVTKEAYVREELVVTKSVHRRVEQIHETVRRTEVETERLQAEESAPAGP